MKKLIVLLSLCVIRMEASDNQLDVIGKNIFSTVVEIALGSAQGKFEKPKFQIKSVVSNSEYKSAPSGYELIIKGGIPSHLVTPTGYTQLIGTVYGDLDDVKGNLVEQLGLVEINEPSPLTLWCGGKRYSVQNLSILDLKAKL